MKHTLTLLTALLLAQATASQAAEPPPAEVLRELTPLSVRGVNCFPRQTPWGGLWTRTPPEVRERDMALAASLGSNTVRTFLQLGSLKPAAKVLREAFTRWKDQ